MKLEGEREKGGEEMGRERREGEERRWEGSVGRGR